MKIGYFALTEQGFELAEKLSQRLPGEIFSKINLKQQMEEAWEELDALVCIMAAGIVVRHVAPLLRGKDKDPAVIVMDSHGQWSVSLLSGHLGGANELAEKLAHISGGQAVVTTATDVEGVAAFDEVAKRNRLLIENLKNIKYVSGKLLNKEAVNVVIDPIYRLDGAEKTLYLRPQTLVLGVGCKKGMDPNRMQEAFEKFAGEYLAMKETVRAVATVDIKAGEEAILSLADKLGVPLMVISRKMIEKLDFEKVPGGPLEYSAFVAKTIGVGSVAEACAWLGAKSLGEGHYAVGRMEQAEVPARLRLKKIRYEGITFALAEMMQKIVFTENRSDIDES